MSLNIPVAALAVVGVVLAIAGALVQDSIFLVLFGILTILFAWLLQELTRRRSS